jgi:dTDP-glucose 4,6-dehydratase
VTHHPVVAVIGSNSFSGSDFVDLILADTDFDVIGISRSPEPSDIFLPYKQHGDARFTFHQLDVNTDLDRYLEVLDEARAEYIVNFAAQSEVGPSWENPDHWYETNALSLVRLTDALNKRDYIKKYVHISSPEVYGTCEGRVLEDAPLRPSTPYAASKAAGDMFMLALAEHKGFPLVMIRATNVYGARQQLWKIIPRSAIYIKSDTTIQLHGGGHSVKSFIHIRDVSRGELAAMLRGKAGEIYHLSPSPDNDGYAVRDIVSRVAESMGTNLAEVSVDVEERLGQDAAYIIDSTKARTELGWSPDISIDDGLQQVVDWTQENWATVASLQLEYQHKK